MTRFILYASMVFVTAFVGVTWAARGFPVTLQIRPSCNRCSLR